MQEKNFDALLGGLDTRAAILDNVKARQLKHLKKDKSVAGKKAARLFIEIAEQPVPDGMPLKVFNLVKKLRKKLWSEEKIRNHIKKHFKITVV